MALNIDLDMPASYKGITIIISRDWDVYCYKLYKAIGYKLGKRKRGMTGYLTPEDALQKAQEYIDNFQERIKGW